MPSGPKQHTNKNKLKGDFSFITDIKKISHQAHPSLHVSSEAVGQLNAFLNVVAKALLMKSLHFKKHGTHVTTGGSVKYSKETLSIRDLVNAIKMVFPGELEKHAVSVLTKSVTKFQAQSGGVKSVRSRAGLVLSPSRLEILIKTFWKGRISGLFKIGFAACLEYIMAEILEIAGNSARDNKLVRIRAQDLFNATSTDEELSKLTRGLKWKWLVANEYFIHDLIGEKFSKRRKMSFGAGKKKKHRKILRDNIQGITKSVIAKLCQRAGIVRISGPVYEEIRGIIRVYLESLIKNSMLHATGKYRSTVLVEDVNAASGTKGYTVSGLKVKHYSFGRNRPGQLSLKKIKHYQRNRGLVIPKAPFYRFVKEIMQDYKVDGRISEKAVLLIQHMTEDYIVDLLKKAYLVSMSKGRLTVDVKDIQLVRRIGA
jgi:histone H4